MVMWSGEPVNWWNVENFCTVVYSYKKNIFANLDYIALIKLHTRLFYREK